MGSNIDVYGALADSGGAVAITWITGNESIQISPPQVLSGIGSSDSRYFGKNRVWRYANANQPNNIYTYADCAPFATATVNVNAIMIANQDISLVKITAPLQTNVTGANVGMEIRAFNIPGTLDITGTLAAGGGGEIAVTSTAAGNLTAWIGPIKKDQAILPTLFANIGSVTIDGVIIETYLE